MAENWDESVDVIVVGSGAAGLLASIKAADAGKSVLLVEKTDKWGGTSALSGGGVWAPSIRGIYALPAKLQLGDVLSAVGMSLGLSFIVTIFPARRAARMNPVEALRYE